MRIGDLNHILYVYNKVDEQDEFGAVDDVKKESVNTGIWNNKTNSFIYEDKAVKSIIKAKVEYATSSGEVSAERKMQPNTMTAIVYKFVEINKDDIIGDPDIETYYTVSSIVPYGKLFKEVYLEKWEL